MFTNPVFLNANGLRKTSNFHANCPEIIRWQFFYKTGNHFPEMITYFE